MTPYTFHLMQPKAFSCSPYFLLGGICLGIMLFTIECIAKHTNLDIPLLDIYDRYGNMGFVLIKGGVQY